MHARLTSGDESFCQRVRAVLGYASGTCALSAVARRRHRRMRARGLAAARRRPSGASRTGTRPPLGARPDRWHAPRSPARSFTRPIFAPPTFRAGRRNTSHAMLIRATGCDARLSPEWILRGLRGALEAIGRGDRQRISTAIGTRVPEFYAGDLFCPVGKTPLYLGQPVGAADLRDVRRLRSGAARVARWNVREVRRGDRSGRGAGLWRAIASRAWPVRRRTRPTSIRRCRPAGSARARSQNSTLPVWSPARQGHRGAPTPRRRSTATGSAPSSRPKIRTCWCSIASSRRSRSTRCFSSRRPVSPGTTGRAAKPRTGARRAVAATRRRSRSRYLLGEARAAIQAGADQHAVRLRGRRLRRPRSHAVPALRGAGGDVLSRPSGAAGARPLPAVPGRDQAARVQDALAHRHRSRDRQDPALSPPTMCSTAAASPTSRPASATVARDRRDRHLRRAEGRRHDGGDPLARRDRGLDARLRHAADDDGARGADRRSRRRRLPLDPIEFRRRNALATNGRTMTGNPLQRLGAHARKFSTSSRSIRSGSSARSRKRARSKRNPGRHRRGLRHQGLRHRRRLLAGRGWNSTRTARIAIHCDDVEMGNGIGTALANRVALHLGGVADEVSVARDRHVTTRSRWSRRAIPTRWTRRRRTRQRTTRAGCRRSARRRARRSARMSARMRAAEAARVIFRFGLWPAALELWRIRADRSAREAMGEGAVEGRAARSCRVLRRCRCQRSPRRRMRATA